ncbi:MAG: DUF2851 family protein [Crocinitomicaceae bacterium]
MLKGLREDYLHFLFEKRLLGSSFTTVDGDQLDIIDFGEYYLNAGPDFLDCIVELNGQKWAGPIEFHVRASDWRRHGHQDDPAYSNVIAHFVYDFDENVQINQFQLPTVEIKDRLDNRHYEKFKGIYNNKNKIPCSLQIKSVAQEIIEREKESRLHKRLFLKSVEILRLLERYDGDLTKLKRVLLARTFGGKVNQLPFEMLVEKIENREIRRFMEDDFEMLTYLFGRSGLLESSIREDKYISMMKNTYAHQCNLFGNKAVELGWKYSRMRPSGFPDIRLAQFSKVLSHIQTMPDWNIHFTLESFQSWLSFELDSYWKSRYRLGGECKKKQQIQLSHGFINVLIINAVVPYMYAIGSVQGNNSLISKSLHLLRSLPAEDNSVVRQWNSIGVNIASSYDSQSFLALQKQGCNQKKCLLCGIGREVLNK